MDEKLIEEIKKHTILYVKGSIAYKNKSKRAEAWNMISTALNIPESACQSRWKSLRDRFVREFNKSHFTSGSESKIAERQWVYYTNMQFLQDHITTRKTSNVPRYFHNTSESFLESKFDPLASGDSFIEYSDWATSPPFIEDQNSLQSSLSVEDQNNTSSETPSTSYRSRKREANSDDLSDFFEKMSKIAEKRFRIEAAKVPKDVEKHKGFFLMVQDLFNKMAEDVIDDCKVFYINYLYNKIKEANENVSN